MNAPESPRQFRHVGTRPVRPDGADKVTGKAVYGPDFVAPGMLFGAMVRSPHPHARIRGIDARKALALPGVKAVVTGADFPSLQSVEMAVGESSGDVVHMASNCMAKGKVLYEGHALAAVAATSQAIADEAVRLIAVDYEVLPHVLGIEEAMAADASVLHDNVFTKGLADKPATPSNVPLRVGMDRGDVDAALAGAAATSSGRYVTEPVHQGYIEPHACVASWSADGQSQVWVSSQGAFAIRSLCASILLISQADIRVTPLEIGGGFGGKTTVYLEPVALLLSKKAGRPVRLAMSRGDVFRATGPAPGAVVDIRMGAAADGTILGVEMEFWFQIGAYPANAVGTGMSSALAHYRLENVRMTGWDVLSNRPASKAYRAPGAPQVCYAVECALDDIALQLGMDPIELRLKNAARPGEKTLTGMTNGAIGYVECLEAARDHPHWNAPLGPNQARGVAGGVWGNYGGPSTAQVSLGEDGSVLVVTGSPDIGGSRASMAIMAAEVLDVPYESVRAIVADTASIGYSMVTGGSRTTFATGKAVIEAAEKVRAELCNRAARTWAVSADAVEWRDGAAHCIAGDQSGKSMPIGAIAARAAHSGGPLSAEVALNAAGWLPGFGVHICDVELDPETGHTSIARYTAVQDVGRAIHPDYVEGQIQGGAVQGIGWALNEAYAYNSAGLLDNAGFLDYRVPVASDMPMIEPVMVEVPNPDHPYGVKGVGEVGIVPPLGAVANAISRAAGVRLRQLPMTPDRVYAAMHGG